MTDTNVVQEFLGQRRFAFVGVSRNPSDFSRSVFRGFTARGYDVIPVNPSMEAVENRPCHRSILDITPPVEAVFLMTPPALTERVARECADAGVRMVWMHRGVGQGAVSPEALAFCRVHGIDVVAGECPYMFLQNTGMLHRIHGFLRRLLGRNGRSASQRQSVIS